MKHAPLGAWDTPDINSSNFLWFQHSELSMVSLCVGRIGAYLFPWVSMDVTQKIWSKHGFFGKISKIDITQISHHPTNCLDTSATGFISISHNDPTYVLFIVSYVPASERSREIRMDFLNFSRQRHNKLEK